jgi:glycosyltransferase involved in cell wall biosynthesis
MSIEPENALVKILVLAKYGTLAASTRQRFMQFRPYFARHGVSIEISPLIKNEQVAKIGSRSFPIFSHLRAYLQRIKALIRGKDYDLLWIHGDLFPYFPGAFEKLAGLHGTPFVVDMDDAIFSTYDDHPRWPVRMLLRRKLEPLLSRAAACTCGNAYLKAYADQFCPTSVVIPTVVDTDAYVPLLRVSSARPVVGWMGSPTTWANVKPVLPAILSQVHIHGARFDVIGAGSQVHGLEGIRHSDWAEMNEIRDLQAMDIGIMPLIDQPFQRGKCGYKLIQYMACGLPVIASPVGVNSEIVEDGVNGFLARTPEEWSAALDRLLGDAELRREMGSEGRRKAEERYSLVAHQDRLLGVLRTAAEVPRGRGSSHQA